MAKTKRVYVRPQIASTREAAREDLIELALLLAEVPEIVRAWGAENSVEVSELLRRLA